MGWLIGAAVVFVLGMLLLGLVLLSCTGDQE